jgi:hypothetical protein
MERSAQLTTHDTDDGLDQPTREAMFDPRSLIGGVDDSSRSEGVERGLYMEGLSCSRRTIATEGLVYPASRRSVVVLALS